MNGFLQVLSILGNLVRALGFLVFGFGVTKFVFDAYGKANWQLQAALVLGFFGLLVGLTNYASPGSAGMYALGAGVVLVMNMMPQKTEEDDKEK
jgi:hypothetical protein